MVKPVLQAVAIAALCAALLAGTHALTGERIASNESAHLRAELAALIGDNLPATAPDWRDDVWTLCDGRRIVRTTAAGYSGPVTLLVGWRLDAQPGILGVRATAHRETPGIADFLDHPARGWLAGLPGATPAAIAEMDTVTGATITSRAVLAALAATATAIAAPIEICTS